MAVSAFFVLTLFVFAPSHLFLTNASEFNATYFELVGYLLVVAVPIFLLLAAFSLLLPQKWDVHKRIVALILSIAFLLWLQGNILVWNYGKLTGGNVEL